MRQAGVYTEGNMLPAACGESIGLLIADQVEEAIVCFKVWRRMFILGNNEPLFYSVKRVYMN
jgi:hypothetical protein